NATDVTLTGDTIAENTGDGVFIFDSDVTGFAIQNSYLGTAPDGMGGSFAGNGANGLDASGSTFMGVAFLDSFFNGNGTISPGDGIFFVEGSTINSRLVTLDDPSMTLTTGFTLENSQVVGNSANGFQFRDV